MKRILIVKTSSMGDVVHNLTTVTDIKRADPDTEIDWLVEKSFAAIPAMHPGVHQVIPVELRHWRHQLLSPTTWQQIKLTRKKLAERAYDVVIDTQGLIKSAMLARWAKRPVSGYDRHSIREPAASIFYTHRYSVSRNQHAVDRNRQLAAQVLGYRLEGMPLDYGIQCNTVDSAIAGLATDYIVCMHGTSRESKLWPEQNWQKLLPALVAAGVQPVLVWGSDAERKRSERLAGEAGSAMIAPSLDLQQLAEISAGARGVIGVDTGPVHLAAALGCPTVALYTDTEPGKTGVVSADDTRSINLGSDGDIPSPHEVMSAIKKLGMV